MSSTANWAQEIKELHDHFQKFFRGEVDSLDRVEAVLAAEFRIVDPRGEEHDRQSTLAGIGAGHARNGSLVIDTEDHRLILRTDDVVVASYVERQVVDETVTRRLSTAVFQLDAAAPNGVVLIRVHETWESGSP
jgi:hypothetical protein